MVDLVLRKAFSHPAAPAACLVVAVLGYGLGLPAIVPLALLLCAAIAATVVTRGTAQNASLGLASLLVAFCIIELLAMALETKVVATRDSGLFVPRLIIGWGPGHPGHYHAVRTVDGHTSYDVSYTIDDRLLRKTIAGTSGKGVAFMGDSYMFGEGLNDADTLPQKFADLEGRSEPVFNLGFSGYNPAQFLAEMQTGMFDDILTKSRLVVLFAAPWQAERTSCKASFVTNAPHYTLFGGKLAYRGTCHPLPHTFASYFATWRTFVAPRLTIISDDDIVNLIDVTKATTRLAREKYNAPVLVYYLRNRGYLHGLTWTDEKIMAALRAGGDDVLDYTIDLHANLKYDIPYDGHPNAFSNAIRAQRLVDFLKTTPPKGEAAVHAGGPGTATGE